MPPFQSTEINLSHPPPFTSNTTSVHHAATRNVTAISTYSTSTYHGPYPSPPRSMNQTALYISSYPSAPITPTSSTTAYIFPPQTPVSTGPTNHTDHKTSTNPQKPSAPLLSQVDTTSTPTSQPPPLNNREEHDSSWNMTMIFGVFATTLTMGGLIVAGLQYRHNRRSQQRRRGRF